jgi:tetratricopeptide (TPR) repeat protein
MPTKLEELVRQATVPLTNSAGQLLGTGFFIAPGLAVSAAHVVHGAVDDKVFAPDRRGILRALTVRIRHPHEVAPGVTPYPLPDLALLDVAPGQFEDTPCVAVRPLGAPRELLAIGYCKSIDPRSAFAPDVARLEFEAAVQVEGVNVIKVKDATVDPGMSGAPVLDLEAGAVVGFVKATRGAGKPYGAYAVAVSELQRFEHSAWGQSELYHRYNPTWRVAKAGDFAGPDPVTATRALAEAIIQEAEDRRDALPSGVNAGALHQSIWLRHSLPAEGHGDSSVADMKLRQRWRTERPLSGLTVVSGDPGFGKSWLLTYQASQVARQTLRQLDEDGVVNECIVPLRLTCATLGSDPNAASSVRGLARALVGASISGALVGAEDQHGYVAVCERALEDGRLLICLDGLDEMPSGYRPVLKKVLVTLLSLNNAVLVTSRPSALPIIEEIGVGNREDFQLMGFGPRETVNFVRAWHQDRPQAADSLLGAFAHRPELAQLAEVPLLLSFLCRLGDPSRRQDYRQTTLPQLYRDVASHLLSGRWRGDRTPTDAEAMPDPVLRMRLLASVIGTLQDSWRGGEEDIARSELRTALRAHPDYAAVAATASVRMAAALESSRHQVGDAAEPVLWEFLYDGILLETADAPLRPSVRFIHPLLREVLLATYLANLPAEEQFACIDRHRWLDPSWLRVIVAAASIVTAPSTFVAHILSVADDPWATQRMLAAQVIAAVPDYRDENTAQAILDAILEGTKAIFEFERRRALDALGELLHSSSRLLRDWAHDRAAGIGAASEDGSNSRGRVELAIDLEVVVSLLETRDATAVRPAQAMLASASYSPGARSRLISGLVAADTREAIDVVLRLLLDRQSGSDQNLTSFLSALQPQANLAVAAATELLRNRQIAAWARAKVGRALLECGPSGVDVVREVAEDRSMDWGIRGLLYAAMLRAAVPDVTAQALHLLANPNAPADGRAELALALVEDGATDAIPEAALALSNRLVDWQVRASVARALARQGTAGRELLIAQLNHSPLDLEVKVRHISALIEVREPAAAEAALRLHSDRGVPTWIRTRTAELLLRFNAGPADEEALIALATSEEQPIDERLTLAVEMIRHAFPSAEMVFMSLLRNRTEDDTPPSWPDAFMRVAESGELGRRSLETVVGAADLDWALRCEALLALGKTLGGVALPVHIEEIIKEMPEMWLNRLILGLARSGIVRDLDEFERVACHLKGGYSIILEFLLRAPVEWAVTSRLLATARQLQIHGTTESEDAAEQDGNIDLNQSLLTELGIEFRSDAEARDQLGWICNALELRVGGRIAALMLQEQLDEFEAIMKDNDQYAALDFLDSSFPEYRALVRESFAGLKAEIMDGRLAPPRILEKPRAVGILPNVSKIASALSEWVALADARRWDNWLNFTYKNTAIIGSTLARRILQLGQEADNDWGLHEAAIWVAGQVAKDNNFDDALLQVPAAIHDYLKGAFESGSLPDLYFGGAWAALRFPQYDFGWWYGAVAAEQNRNHRLALSLVRQAGETRPPAEREDGAAVLEHFQLRLGWPAELSEEFRVAYIEGMRERTISDYERAVEDDPGWAQNHFNLGIALQQAGRHDEATAAYQRAVELEPNDALRHRTLASVLEVVGRHDEALIAIDRALAIDASDPNAHTTHGIILTSLRREEEALLAFRKAYQFAPKSHVCSRNLGGAFYRLKRFEEAAAVFRQEIERSPRDMSSRAMLGASLTEMGRSDEGLIEFTKALEIDPANRDVLIRFGYALSRMGRPEDAIPVLKEALQIDPDDEETLSNLEFQFWRLGRHEDAVEYCRQAIERRPGVAAYLQLYGEALRWSGRLNEAAEACSKALELAPDDINVLSCAGFVYCDQERYVDAVAVLSRARDIDPADSTARNNLGVALLLSTAPDEAALELREALRLSTECPTEAEVLLAVAIHGADADESRRLARAALGRGPERGITSFRNAELRAIAYLICGELDAAIEVLRAAKPSRRPEDRFQSPLYALLREIAPGLVERFVAEWPH